jgi:hypothetical protein
MYTGPPPNPLANLVSRIRTFDRLNAAEGDGEDVVFFGVGLGEGFGDGDGERVERDGDGDGDGDVDDTDGLGVDVARCLWPLQDARSETSARAATAGRDGRIPLLVHGPQIGGHGYGRPGPGSG